MLKIEWRIPWQIPKGDLINSFFQKTSLSSSKIGFFIKKNELIKSPLGICQGILHSILSILTYYGSQTDIPIKSYTRFKLKKNSIKKTFCHYEWRDPPREPCLAIFIGEFHQLLPRVQLANSIGKFPPKIDLL